MEIATLQMIGVLIGPGFLVGLSMIQWSNR